MAECLFCAAVSGSLGVVEVWSSPEVFAFLDHRPVFKGHVLVVPRAHTEVLGDLAADAVGPYFVAVQRTAVAVERGLGAQGSFVALNNRVSQSVPHLHTHVVPRTKGDGLRGFFWPRTKYDSPDEERPTQRRSPKLFEAFVRVPWRARSRAVMVAGTLSRQT